MAKEDQIIAVVPTEVLFKDKYFQGFLDANEFDYESVILNNLQYERRGGMDPDKERGIPGNPDFKQPIGYGILVNPKLKQIYAYQRSSDDNSDKNLQGKWSWGVGGHIEERGDNPISKSLEREISEEVSLNGPIVSARAIGYLNDDSNDVGKLHLGVLYVLETPATEAKPVGDEVYQGGFRSVSDISNLVENANVETWSQIALDPLKRRY